MPGEPSGSGCPWKYGWMRRRESRGMILLPYLFDCLNVSGLVPCYFWPGLRTAESHSTISLCCTLPISRTLCIFRLYASISKCRNKEKKNKKKKRKRTHFALGMPFTYSWKRKYMQDDYCLRVFFFHFSIFQCNMYWVLLITDCAYTCREIQSSTFSQVAYLV